MTYKVKVVQEVRTIIEYEIEADNEEQARDKVYGLDPSEGNEVWDDLTYFDILDIEEVNNSQQELKEMKNTVTPEQVKENMQDVIVRTLDDFGKPCTYVTVRMKNGFTLRESTTCVDPANYNEEIGKEICLKKIEDKVWFLLGYQLQEDLFRSGELVL